MNNFGPVPTIITNSKDLKNREGKFLIDTGANISIISKNSLANLKFVKASIPVIACAGNSVPVEGHILLQLEVQDSKWPQYHFWVTPHTFDKFDGIIGTDILSDMNAIIDCQSNNIRIENPVDRFAPTTAPLHCGTYQAMNKRQYAEISKMTPRLNKKQKKKTLQVIVKECQVIPPQSHMLVKAYFRLNPLLNTTFEIPQSMLRADGVFIGHSIVRIQADGSVVVPIANFSNRPYILKRKRIFALARIVPPGSDPPARGSSDDMGNDQPANPKQVQETPEKADDVKKTLQPTPETGDTWNETELPRATQASQQPLSNSSTPPRQGTGTTPPDSNSSTGRTGRNERQQPHGRGQQGDKQTPPQQPKILEQGSRQGTSSQPKSSTPNRSEMVEELSKQLEESSISVGSSNFDRSRIDSDSSEDEPGMALFDMPTPPRRPSTPVVSITQDSPINAEQDTSTLEQVDSTVIEVQEDENDDTVHMDDSSETSVVMVTEAKEEEPYYPKAAATLSYLELLQPRNTVPEVGAEALEWLEKRDRAAIQTLEAMLPATTDAIAMPNPDDSRAAAQGRRIADDDQPPFERRDVTSGWAISVAQGSPYPGKPMDLLLEDAISCSEVPGEHRCEFKNLLLEYQDIFRTEGDPTFSCPLFEQAIPLSDDIPVNQKQYPLPRAAREALKERVDEFLDAQIIQPSNSGYNSPVWMVPKKEPGKWRLCIDFRALNKKIIHDPFPLPRIEETLEEFRGAEFISSADLFWGFYHVKVKPEDTHKLAFSTNEGRYEFTQLPMGLKIAPAVFQRMMNMVFSDHIGKFMLVYMDDLIVYSPTAEKHLEHLEKLFSRMRHAGLRFKIDKCQFFKKQVKFLGFLISNKGISLDPGKVKVVTNFPKPDKDVGELQSFLGMVGYFKRHIPNYAKIAKPLFDMLRGEEVHKKKRKGEVRAAYKKNEWGPEQEEAFTRLKEAVTTAPVLVYPDFNKPFILTTDASSYALGYVLSQDLEDGEHPIAYGSRILKGAELNYSNTEREMLAVIKGMEHFRSYLYGRHFLVRTDHQAIPLIHKGKTVSQRVCKWILATEDFDFDVEYVPATKIRHADALSRIKVKPNNCSSAQTNMLEGADQRQWEPCIDYSGWGKAQQEDPSLQDKYKKAQTGHDPALALKDTVLYELVDGRFVPLAPTAIRTTLIRQFHGPPAMGHLGSERTFYQMRKYLYWPSMRRDVEAYIERCDLCQRHKRSYVKVPLQRQYIPCKPFHTVTMDVVGPIVPTQYNERYILVMQDQLTKWVELAAMKTCDTQTILDKFHTYWISRYGPPERLLTDRASTFVGSVMEAYCKFFGIQKIHTTAYRPQGNGSNERMHLELTKYFSIYLDGDSKSKWRWLLQDAAHAYNIAYHTALKASPYEILFGEKPSLGPLGIPTDTREEDNFPRYFGIRRKQLLLKRKMAQEAVNKAQDRMLALKNKHAHKIRLQIGDQVLYKNHVPKTKFDPKFKGPWRIVNIISPVVFELEKEGRRFSAHASYLKLYKPAINTSENNNADLNKSENLMNQEQEAPLEGEVTITRQPLYQRSEYSDRNDDEDFYQSMEDSDNYDNDFNDESPRYEVQRSEQYVPKRLQARYSGPLKAKPSGFIKNMKQRFQRFIEDSSPTSEDKEQGRGRRERRHPVKYDDYVVSYKG